MEFLVDQEKAKSTQRLDVKVCFLRWKGGREEGRGGGREEGKGKKNESSESSSPPPFQSKWICKEEPLTSNPTCKKYSPG